MNRDLVLLNAIARDYERWVASLPVKHPTEPEEGVKHRGWRAPDEWGGVVESFTAPSPSLGLPCEHLLFANGERVRRFLVPIHGYE